MIRRTVVVLCAIAVAIPATAGARQTEPVERELRRVVAKLDEARARGVPLPDTPVEGSRCNVERNSSCPDGTFAVHEGFIGRRSPRLDLRHEEIRLDNGRISTATGCGPVDAIVRVTEDGYRVSATLPDCSDEGDVFLQGLIDLPTGGTFVGSISSALLQDIPIVATKGQGDRVRLGTYNTQFLPSTFRDKYYEDAAKRISERIISSRYDVIALNEVFDEDAKQNGDVTLPGFVDELKSVYPHYVQYLTGDFSTGHEDSGLMLFSRFPFEDLPKTDYQVDSGDCESTDCAKVAFYEFDSCDDDDCLAEKGAGFVRVRNPETHTILNVAFTHMQAPYFDDPFSEMVATFDTRAEQLGEIKKLIEGTLHPHQIDTENLYVVGDINIDGDLAAANLGDPRNSASEDVGAFAHNRFEWDLHFGSSASAHGGWFYNRLRDAIFDTSPADRLITNRHHFLPDYPPGDARLDYVLRSAGTPGASRLLCVQHLTLAHNLRHGAPVVESGLGQPGTEAGAIELSDHLGVTVDLGRPAPLCSAADAMDLQPAEGDTIFQGGSIVNGGGTQWYRIDEPGTYGLWLSTDDLSHHVYDDEDLSMPLANYKELSRTLMIDRVPYEFKMFLVPEAPFYVRVFEPGFSGWTGNYTLGVHRFDCSSKQEACLLAPGTTMEAAFKSGVFVGNDDAFWYEMHTEAPGWTINGQDVASGERQHLSIEANRMPTSVDVGDASVQLRDETGMSILREDVVPEPDVAEPDYGSTPTQHLVLEHPEEQERAYFVRVGRKDPQIAFPFRIGWTTDLTTLHGSQVGVPNAVPFDFVVADHGDPVGDEEFYWWLEADGHVIVAEQHLGDFPEPDNRVLEGYVTSVRYVSSARVSFWEVDDGYDNPPSPDIGHIDNDDLVQTTIGPLAGSCATGESVAMADDEGEGSYAFTFNRCYGLPT